jgi:flagellar biosynthesis/type III secretory pathway M-ring protein FliF/YscJ
MHHALAALVSAAATPTPTPTVPEVDPELVTPGVTGFLITAFIALAVIVLVWDMMRRIRRGRVRADIQEELDAEEQAARAAAATEADDESIDAAGDDQVDGAPDDGEPGPQR